MRLRKITNQKCEKDTQFYLPGFIVSKFCFSFVFGFVLFWFGLENSRFFRINFRFCSLVALLCFLFRFGLNQNQWNRYRFYRVLFNVSSVNEGKNAQSRRERNFVFVCMCISRRPRYRLRTTLRPPWITKMVMCDGRAVTWKINVINSWITIIIEK